MEIPPLRLDLPIIDALPVPFWAVTIERPMRTFASSLGLTPHVPGVPSGDIAAAILTGRRSFQAWIRRELGDVPFRNLKNYATGKVTNSRALDALKAQYVDSPGFIDLLADSVRGQHNSTLERGVAVAEGVAFRLVLWIHSQPLLCHCCGQNVIATPNYWWSRQPCNIGMPETDLIDRMCMVMIGGQFLLNLQSNGQRRTSLQDLAKPEDHPFGNWIRTIMEMFRAHNATSLPARAGAAVTSDSVLRYSRGEMLTPEAVKALTSKLPNSADFVASARTARALAFTIEFLLAANRDSPLTEEVARSIVSNRVSRLLKDIDAIGSDAFGKTKSIGVGAENLHLQPTNVVG